MALIFPFSQSKLEVLRAYYTLYAAGQRAIFECRSCRVRFIVTPANVGPAYYDWLERHGQECRGPGANQGPLPARVRPFGTRHER